MYCRKCGNKIVDGGKFCGSCGTAVVKTPPKKQIVKEEIIEVEQTKLESLETDSKVLGIVAATMVIGIIMIVAINMI